MIEKNSYIFVANPQKISCKLPFVLIPKYSLRKATKKQINRIKHFLDRVINLHASGPNWYEIRVVPDETNNQSWSYHQLNQKDWKYYVISYEGWGDEWRDLQFSSNLSTAELQFGAHFHNGSYGWYPTIFNYFSNIRSQQEYLIKEINEEDLLEIVKIYEEITHINSKYPDIKRAIKMFDDIKLIPRITDLYILGLFSIIELLITHQPDQNKMGASITHQIKNKIPLLFNRFKIPIEYSNYFTEEKADKIWKTLYKFRSHVAHGQEINFKSNDFKMLNDKKNVLDFLYKTTKNLLRNALIEPRLYSDLKAC